jgi:hypothetical protein
MFIELTQSELVDKIFDSRNGYYDHNLPTKADIIRCLHKHSATTTKNLIMPIGTEISQFYDKEAFMKIVRYLASKPENERYLIATKIELMQFLKAPTFMLDVLASFNAPIQVWHISYDTGGNYYFLFPSQTYKEKIELPDLPARAPALPSFKQTLF